MNSPEPGSPISSDSSGSPPPDDYQLPQILREQQQQQSQINAASQIYVNIPSLPGSSSKRRLPGGSGFAAASSHRDAKTRKREDAMGILNGYRRSGGEALSLNTGVGSSIGPNSAVGGGGGGGWVRGEHGGRRDKDDLVDIPLAEQLRKEFGDPFQDDIIKSFC